MLATAIEGNAIEQNPCDGVRLPARSASRWSSSPLNEVHTLASAMRRPEYAFLALLINAGPPAHPLAMMKRLGHSSITVTYDTYGHLFPALEEALTDSLDRSYRTGRDQFRPRDPRGSGVDVAPEGA